MSNEAFELARECYEDPVLFCRTFFPSVFVYDIPWFHRGLLALCTGRVAFLDRYGELDKIQQYFVWENGEPIFDLDSQKIVSPLGRYNCFLIPAEHGRSTLSGLALPSYNLLYHESNLMGYVAHSDIEAKHDLAILKKHFTENPRVIGIFGDKRPDAYTGGAPRTDYFTTSDGQSIICSGIGGRVKSVSLGSSRLDLILINDIERDENVRDDNWRRKLRNWFYSEVITDAQILYFTNLRHRECLPTILERDPDWKVLRLSAILDDDTALWPRLLNRERLEARRRSLALAGQEDAFRLRYLNQIDSKDSSDFVLELDNVVDQFLNQIRCEASDNLELYAEAARSKVRDSAVSS